MDQNLKIEPVSWQHSREDLARIRQQVFVQEQGVSIEDEWDDADENANHFLARLNNQPVGCARLLENGKIGRMAVLAEYRGRGIGDALLKTVIDYAREQGHRELFLDAQTQALDFYAHFGFVADGPEFQDAGITHRRMHLKELKDRKTSTSSAENPVVRLEGPGECLAALQEHILDGRRSLDILSDSLTASLYTDPDLLTRISALARRSRQSKIRILLRDTRPLKDNFHGLVQLAQRLPSRMEIRGLSEMPKDPAMGFFLVDKQSLVYFNSEADFFGFSNRNARPEAGRLMTEFDHLWEHYGFTDPNLKVMHL